MDINSVLIENLSKLNFISKLKPEYKEVKQALSKKLVI